MLGDCRARMPVQPNLFEDPPESVPAPEPDRAQAAPVWLQRISLFILVIFCVYLGVIVTVLPWWTAIWDRNLLLQAHPRLLAMLRLGFVKGIVSGFGLLDIWIGISEAVHYRDHRD
jgi:hypothetical protein